MKSVATFKLEYEAVRTVKDIFWETLDHPLLPLNLLNLGHTVD